jgi:peptidoglycan/LPS O-acetylase OafA/YrhL
MAPQGGKPSRRALRRARGARLRARTARRPRDEHVTDLGDPRVRRKWLAVTLAVMVASAAGGILWYVLEPGVGSYQAGYTLALPALITALVWIGRRLPRWLDWVIAIALATGGSAAYVLVGGSQWWLWAQVAMLPLVLLVVTGARPTSPENRGRTPWYGGMQDGPWGPP